ncbi:uncharacterized protein [Anoplolepis gracilipes]|uniref:uncharacterized protein isoform X2 n=1 Tax=Anoplolepis gracilipes TaxID=354296 RepID=UPI003B9E8AE4
MRKKKTDRLQNFIYYSYRLYVNYFTNFAYRPKRRTPLESYMRRLSLQYVYPDKTVLNKQILAKIYTVSVLYISQHQRSIKLITFGKTKLNKIPQSSKLKQEKKRFFCSMISLIVGILAVIIICTIIKGVIFHVMEKNTTQLINNHTSFKFVKNIKVVYYNQESDIWDSLDITLTYSSSKTLNVENPICLNPENFGEAASEIIDISKEWCPAKKIIGNILNINTKAVMALHNLCNRINPLDETIYILTLQIDNYQLSQKKLTYIQRQIYHKLLNSIDQDTVIAFIMYIRVDDYTSTI